MNKCSSTVQTGSAFLFALSGFGLAGLIFDRTPLLTKPSVDLSWPSGLVGVALGLWSASVISKLPSVSGKWLGRGALWIFLPLLLGFGLAALHDRVREEISFRRGGEEREETVLILEKGKRISRTGRVFYDVYVANPFDRSHVQLRVGEATFDAVKPLHDCTTLLVQHAPDGTARLLMTLRWNVKCPHNDR